jgi:hypothetical protein
MKKVIQKIRPVAKKNQDIYVNPCFIPAIGTIIEPTIGINHAGVICSILK